ncbi:PI3K/PI4K catalytic domain-containing protein [Plasmodiophora brassicae]
MGGLEVTIMVGATDLVVISARVKPAAKSATLVDHLIASGALSACMAPLSPAKFHGRRIDGSEAGLSGAYALNTSVNCDCDPEWVFKPRSEEAQKAGQALKSGAARGESCSKEVAAFLVDHGGFAGVPETRALVADVQLPDRHMKEFGSLQRYVDHEGSCEEFGTGLFDADNIHRIGLLDLRIANMDRHEGNLLLSREVGGLHRLIPIDHGYCLPSWRQLDDIYFCWSSWRQASVPFSEETRCYVASLQPIRDIPVLIAAGVQHESIVTYVLCSFFVQQAVAQGRTLAQIADAMQRKDAHVESDFELLVREAAARTGFDKVHLTSTSHWGLPIVASFLKAFLSLAHGLLSPK